ncbi:MAG: hypothetical protein JW986_03590 [Methanotrichaceae archaeon]|nr:hypothetical protein [Methanotrichaceae archaeon]
MDRSRINWEELGAYGLAIGICIFILIWVLRLWEANLTMPFDYQVDTLLTCTLIKGVLENGWYQINPYLGMPGILEMYDFPLTNNLDFMIMKVIGLFNPNYAIVMNLYYLLTFPLTTLTAMLAIKRLGIDTAAAIVGSILFTFIPYHILRGENHLVLSSYYMIPLMSMVLLWFYHPPPWPLHLGVDGLKRLMSRPWITALAICLLISSTYIYYPFFSCFFLLIAGLTSYWRWREKERLGTALLLILVISAGVFANLIPSIAYYLHEGPNPAVAIRLPGETETYGLKIVQLLLPISDHRIPQLAEIAEWYSESAPPVLVNENTMASLGIIAGAGFLILILGAFMLFSGGRGEHNLLNGLITLNLSAVLLATIGGFGTLFALLVSAQIRNYNRISIFIAFFCILAVLLVLEIAFNRWSSIRSKPVRSGLLLLILMVGILDQSSPAFAPRYGDIREEFRQDEDFISSIEEIMPEGAMIFQLPYVPFPENQPAMMINMPDYEHFKAYLHSRTLRWSYGAVKNREASEWQNSIAEKSVGEMVSALSMAGFEGIYIDGNGYNDRGLSIVNELSDLLDIKPLADQKGRRFFFDMREYNIRNSQIDISPIAICGPGWYRIEYWDGVETIWMENNGDLIVYSSSDNYAKLSFGAIAVYDPKTLEILINDEHTANTSISAISLTEVEVPIRLKKGKNIIVLRSREGCRRPCDIPELNNPDWRCLSLAFQDIDITLLPASGREGSM